MRRLEEDIRSFTRLGGRDAYSFAIVHKPWWGNVAGKEIQRMINEDLERYKQRKGRD